MSNRYFDVLMTSECQGNYIPLGRQLPRTPPSQSCVKHLDFHSEQDQALTETYNEENQDPNSTFDFNTPPVKQDSSDDPQSMVKGMKGYQLTPADLEFMQKLKEEKELKKLQDDLKDLQNELRKAEMALELALASKKNAEAKLLSLPSCEEIRKLSEVVLEMTAPSIEISELDTKSLLALVTKENAKKAIEVKRMELKKLGKMVEMKKKKDAKERGLLEKQIAIEQMKIHSLMSELAELKSALARQEEANKTLQTQQPSEIREDAVVEEKAETRRVKPKDRKLPARTEKLQDSTKQSKPTRRANNRSVVKDEPNKTTTTQTKKATKPIEVTQKKEQSTPQETTVKGRRKAAAPVSQAKTQRKVKEVEAKATSEPGCPPAPAARGRKRATVSAPEQGQDAAALRRSRRIASRK